MAKKRKQRSSTGTRSPVAAQTIRPSPAPSRPAGDSNRQARKEQARKQREALRRKMARRRQMRRAAIGLGSVAAVAAIVFFMTRPRGGPLTTQEQALLRRAPQAASAAGCADVTTVRPYPRGLDRSHVGAAGVSQMPPLSTYPSTPPVSGPHSGSTLGAGVYRTAPPIDQVLHSLEHGAAVIWHSPTALARTLTQIQRFFESPGHGEKVIIAPYNYPDQGPAGRLPAGKEMVLAAWHHTRSCDELSLPVAFDFVAHYSSPAPKGQAYKGDAPEPTAPI